MLGPVRGPAIQVGMTEQFFARLKDSFMFARSM